MANDDRDGRLLTARTFNDAIASLSKVEDEQRITFVHDRMMSAIDDICKKHQGTGRDRFTAAQILILKEIIFQVIYVVDTRNRPAQGFLRSLWSDFKAQSPLKQVGIATTVITFIAGTGYSAYSTWIGPYFWGKLQSESAAKSTSNASPRWQDPPAIRSDKRLDPETADAIQRLMDAVYRAQSLKPAQSN